MDDFFLQFSFCTAIGCTGNHSHEKISIFGYYKYSVKEFYDITCCYVKEQMDICSYCKKMYRLQTSFKHYFSF